MSTIDPHSGYKGPTKLGWMENRQLETGQYHCPECDKIFHYANDMNDTLPPKFCPECGRKNLRA